MQTHTGMAIQQPREVRLEGERITERPQKVKTTFNSYLQVGNYMKKIISSTSCHSKPV